MILFAIFQCTALVHLHKVRKVWHALLKAKAHPGGVVGLAYKANLAGVPCLPCLRAPEQSFIGRTSMECHTFAHAVVTDLSEIAIVFVLTEIACSFGQPYCLLF